MRWIAGTILLAGALALPGCQQPPATTPIASGDTPRAALGGLTVRQAVEGTTPPVPRDETQRMLFARARLVGMQHGAASRALSCVPARDADPFLALKGQRERAMAAMATSDDTLNRIAARASAGASVIFEAMPGGGCATAVRQAAEALRSDPWAGHYGSLAPRR